MYTPIGSFSTNYHRWNFTLSRKVRCSNLSVCPKNWHFSINSIFIFYRFAIF